ncbi:MAG: twin-arginine translocase TatA/TatE family subunit [Planctomycetes bacterium]|nr:twin-arginine translocase TatA/TatE family subunit [Planctomycetota bacterium]
MFPLAFVLGVPEMIVLGLIILLLFGSRLPTVMRSLGQSVVEFKKGTRDAELEDQSDRDNENSSNKK